MPIYTVIEGIGGASAGDCDVGQSACLNVENVFTEKQAINAPASGVYLHLIGDDDDVQLKIESTNLTGRAGVILVGGDAEEPEIDFGTPGDVDKGRIQYGNPSFADGEGFRIYTNNQSHLMLDTLGNLSIKGNDSSYVPTSTLDIVGTIDQAHLKVTAHSTQTDNLQEWLDDVSTILTRINKDGYFMTRKVTAPADGDLASSEASLWLDDTVGDTKLILKAKDSAGTVVSKALTSAWPEDGKAMINTTSYDTIQDAVDAASDGDTIKIGAGIFTESVLINGIDDLKVKGTAPFATKIVGAGGTNNFALKVEQCDDLSLSDVWGLVDSTSATSGLGIWITLGSLRPRLERVKGEVTAGTTLRWGINIDNSSTIDAHLLNCIGLSSGGAISYGANLQDVLTTVTVTGGEYSGDDEDISVSGSVTVSLEGPTLLTGSFGAGTSTRQGHYIDGTTGNIVLISASKVESSIIVPEDGFVGLGASDGRLVFDSTTTPDQIVAQDANIGINTVDARGNLTVLGTAQNSGPASVLLGGVQVDEGFTYTEVFRVAVTSSIEISRATATGQNGFAGFVKITVVGHTGGAGNGGLVNEYTFSNVTTTLARSLDMYTTNAPTLALVLAGNVLTISLASSDGINTFNGMMKIEYFIPPDFGANTWEVT